MAHNFRFMQTTPAHTRPAALGPAQADAVPADVLARMTLDLDAQGHFASGELLLTASELVQFDVDGGRQAWPLDSAQRLQHTDLAGVATLAYVAGSLVLLTRQLFGKKRDGAPEHFLSDLVSHALRSLWQRKLVGGRPS